MHSGIFMPMFMLKMDEIDRKQLNRAGLEALKILNDLSLVVGKPVFGVFNQV